MNERRPLLPEAADNGMRCPGSSRLRERAPTVDDAARVLLRHHHRPIPDPHPAARAGDDLATAVMDLYRCTGSAEAFETLVRLSRDQLLRRVRARMRGLGGRVDADELLQDAYINIYRYPERFDASRPGAFRAWSSTIVDNAVRRRFRRRRVGPEVALHPVDLLAQEPDKRSLEPAQVVADDEAYRDALTAFTILLRVFLHAYQSLSERERFVLQMVEVRGVRYAELAQVLSIRPEALKMVVFRARRRIFDRISSVLPPATGKAAPHASAVAALAS